MKSSFVDLGVCPTLFINGGSYLTYYITLTCTSILRVETIFVSKKVNTTVGLFRLL